MFYFFYSFVYCFISIAWTVFSFFSGSWIGHVFSTRFELLELHGEGLKWVIKLDIVTKVLYSPAYLDSSRVLLRRHVITWVLVDKRSMETTGCGWDVHALDELEGASGLDRLQTFGAISGKGLSESWHVLKLVREGHSRRICELVSIPDALIYGKMCLTLRYNGEFLLALQWAFGVVVADANAGRAPSLRCAWTRNLYRGLQVSQTRDHVGLLVKLVLIHRRLACLTSTSSSHFRVVLASRVRPSLITPFYLDGSVHGAYTTHRFRSLSEPLKGVLDAWIERSVSKRWRLADITWLIQMCHKVGGVFDIWWLWQDIAFIFWAFESVRRSGRRWWMTPSFLLGLDILLALILK